MRQKRFRRFLSKEEGRSRRRSLGRRPWFPFLFSPPFLPGFPHVSSALLRLSPAFTMLVARALRSAVAAAAARSSLPLLPLQTRAHRPAAAAIAAAAARPFTRSLWVLRGSGKGLPGLLRGSPSVSCNCGGLHTEGERKDESRGVGAGRASVYSRGSSPAPWGRRDGSGGSHWIPSGVAFRFQQDRRCAKGARRP